MTAGRWTIHSNFFRIREDVTEHEFESKLMGFTCHAQGKRGRDCG